MNSFEELDCWKLAREIRNEVRILVKKFPIEEKNKLTDQMIRASRSVTNNIAEGFGRFHYQENIQYCRTSRGSLSELKDHLTIALDEEYIDPAKFQELFEKVDRNINILNGYISYLKRKKDEG
jgi:four helix bundle protein